VNFTFEAKLWQWNARQSEGWIFVTLPPDASAQLRDLSATMPRRGFGSMRASVTIGASRWSTSIFPSSDDDSYVLPIKKAVRQAEGLDAGDLAAVTVQLL
jgi:hypothetical protein